MTDKPERKKGLPYFLLSGERFLYTDPMMDEDILAMGNKIRIRLFSVEYPDERLAVVSFELFSDGHTVGEPDRPLAMVRHEVRLNGRGRYNYSQIVATAASKLSADFRQVSETLSTKHVEESAS